MSPQQTSPTRIHCRGGRTRCKDKAYRIRRRSGARKHGGCTPPIGGQSPVPNRGMGISSLPWPLVFVAENKHSPHNHEHRPNCAACSTQIRTLNKHKPATDNVSCLQGMATNGALGLTGEPVQGARRTQRVATRPNHRFLVVLQADGALIFLLRHSNEPHSGQKSRQRFSWAALNPRCAFLALAPSALQAIGMLGTQ